jgi:DNA-binding NarL/FixJ family response regulator
VVGTSAEALQTQAAYARHRPRVVVVHGPDAFEVVRHLPGAAVLAVVGSEADAAAVIRAGAAGALLEDATPQRLADAVRAIALGNRVVPLAVAQHLAAQPLAPARYAARLDELTSRERDVLALMARGLSNHEIGVQLFVCETTVKTHVTRVLSKLGIRSRAQAVVVAYESGVAVARSTTTDAPVALAA